LLWFAVVISAAAAAPAQYNGRDAMRMSGRQAGPTDRGRDWHRYRDYDFDRIEPGQRGYFADRYYRQSHEYHPRTLGPADRIYRGSNSLYYCRRSDGTTGQIEHGLVGSRLDAVLRKGESAPLAVVARRPGEEQLLRSVEQGKVACR
jgi:hypothetical protein